MVIPPRTNKHQLLKSKISNFSKLNYILRMHAMDTIREIVLCSFLFSNELYRAPLKKATIGAGNGLVSGNKPLPQPILTQIYVATWRH